MHRLLAVASVLVLAACAFAADWTQFGGPNRDGICRETGLIKSWPAEGPKLLWSSDQMGMGYSGPAVVGDRIYIMGGDKKKEYLYALDVKTGKRQWEIEIGGYFEESRGGGPRGTPTVVDGLLYVIGARGNLLCVRAETGAKVWSVNLIDDLKGRLATWGYTESPLVDGDQVVCTPGGKNGTLAALDRKTGKVIWRSTEWTDPADYASIIIGMPHNTKEYMQMTSQSVAGVDPKTGKLLWRFPRRQRITIPNVISSGNYVYITSSYGAGCNLLELTSPTEYREVYSNKNMANHHGGVILWKDHIFGYSDTKGSWVCQDLKSGDIVWASKKLGKGSILYADGCFFCYAEADGTLAVIEANTQAWKEKGRFKIATPSKMTRPRAAARNVWTHPVIANGRLYLRDQEMLCCYDVKDPTAP